MSSTTPVTETLTMRAITHTRYGGSDVLRLAQVPRPVVGHGQVLIRVHAAGLDRGTEHLMTGKPYARSPRTWHPPPEEPGAGSRRRRDRPGGRRQRDPVRAG